MPVEVLEHVLRALREGVLVVDAAGRRVYANEEAARLTGYPSVEALLEAPAGGGGRPLRDPRPRPAGRSTRWTCRAAGRSQARTRRRCSSASGRATAPSASRRCGAPPSGTTTGARAYVITFFREVTEQVSEADQVEALYLHAQQTTRSSTPSTGARRSGSASGTATSATCGSTRRSRGSTSGRPRITSAARSTRSSRSSPTTSR